MLFAGWTEQDGDADGRGDGAMKSAIVALSVLLFASPPLPAHAQARSEADCEKIEEALAYNACLAEHGPRVGERRPTSAGAARTPANPVQRRPDGKKAATFDVITGKK
jgi:hypothetical protein